MSRWVIVVVGLLVALTVGVVWWADRPEPEAAPLPPPRPQPLRDRGDGGWRPHPDRFNLRRQAPPAFRSTDENE